MQELSTPQVQAQIKQHINSITQDPTFQNVVQRGAYDQQKMKKFAELTKDGTQLAPENQEYLRQKQDYLKTGVYSKDANLSGDVYANADMTIDASNNPITVIIKLVNAMCSTSVYV